jgi:predicted DNA-binding transcriptional regulator AlpA
MIQRANLDVASPGEAPLLIDAGEFARLLGVSTRTLWRLLAGQQLISPIKLGGSTRWRLSDVRAWIERGCQPGDAHPAS